MRPLSLRALDALTAFDDDARLRLETRDRAKNARRRRDRANGKPTTCRRCGATYPEGEGCALC